MEQKEFVDKYIEIGKITNTHALKGEMKVIYWCDDPEFLLDLDYFFLDKLGREKIEIQSSRLHKNFFIIKVKDIDDISQTKDFINKILYIKRDKILLKEGEYLQCDLIGLDVIDIDTNKNYGKIYKITQTGANDVYYIRNNIDSENKEYLIPAIKDVIKSVDLENNLMKIRPLKGLFDI
ncbi:MAG: 16S rRNA processing protein RimM [Oscillospiraceae bacterium]|nr:16S rRNA processing protein RimM [Oscillospiraceae bacterium]